MFIIPESPRFLVLHRQRDKAIEVLTKLGGADAAVRKAMLERGIEISGGFGPLAGKVWRIGLMGFSARAENVILCLSALEAVLSQMGAPINKGVALSAAQSVYTD